MKKNYYTYIDGRLFYDNFTRSQKLRFNKILTDDDIIQKYKNSEGLNIQLDYNKKIKTFVFEEKPHKFNFKYTNDTIIILYKNIEIWGEYLSQEEITETGSENNAEIIAECIELATLDKDNYFYKKIDNNKRVEKILEKIVNSKILFHELTQELKNYLLKLKKSQ